MEARDPDSGLTTPTVTVRGDAFLRVEPDEAILWLTLSALEDAPGPALSDVAARSRSLVALLDEIGVAKADRSTTGITVREEFDYTEKGRRRSLGHRALSRVSVRQSDPEQIGQLIAQATENLSARIEGPQWLVSPDNPVRLDAARQAAAAARRKAEAFADGVGARLGRPVGLSEPGVRVHNVRRRDLASGIYSMAAPPADDEAMPVERGEHEITASIEATFTLELG